MKIKKYRWCVAGLVVAMVMSSCSKATDSGGGNNQEVIEEKQLEENKEESVAEIKNSYFFDTRFAGITPVYRFYKSFSYRGIHFSYII